MASHPTTADFDALVQRLPVAVYRTTPDGRIVAGNPALAQLLGAESVEELLVVDVRRLYVDARARDHMVERVARGVSIPPEEIELRRLDGGRIWVRVTSHGVPGPDGSVDYYEGVLEDVTARRNADARLVESHLLLDTLMRIQTGYIAGADTGDVFDALLADLLALTQSEYGFIARVLTGDDGARFLRTYAISNIAWNEETREMYERHGPRGMEFHNLDTLFGHVVTDAAPVVANDPLRDPRRGGRPSGHPPLDAFLGLPILKAGEVVGVVGVANRPGGYDEPLTEYLGPFLATVGGLIEATRSDEARRAAEAREQAREQLYRAVVEVAVDAVIAFDEEGTIAAFNPAAERMSGYTEAEIVGRKVADLVPPDRLGEYLGLLRRAPADGLMSEITIRHRSGDDFPAEVSFGRIEMGGRVMIMAIVRDIAERKVTEAALRSAKEAAERTNRAKDLFLASMSHELRTPLNAVIGLASILGRESHGPLTEKQAEYLTQIEASGRHLLSLINDVLDLAKIEADKLDPDLESVAVAELVTEAVALIREAAAANGVRLELDVPDEVPPVLADRRRTKQVLLNLLSNAAKFTPEGGTITLDVAADGNAVVFGVSDTGPGIPVEHLSDIFVPFEQLDSSLARSHGGTGLGLALSKQFIELQGGSIAVDSEVGIGSRFSFRLPAELPADPVPSERHERDADPVAATPVGHRVLVVEDNAVNRMMVTDYLGAHGLDLEVAVDGEQALEKARSWLPDAILMDVQLPKRDGLSATRELKADPATRHIPIIALTALAMKGDAERCLAAGCDAYLSKPCDPADVLAAVEQAMRG